MVNIFEAGLVLLLLWLGVVLANVSPPCAPDGSRFHDPVGHLAPQIERTAQRWVASVGGPGNADMIFPENVEGPWLRRALAPFEVMLTNGACVMPCGRLLVPAIKLTASGKLRFSALQCIDAILSGLSLVHWWVRYNVLTARLFCLGC